CLLDRPTPYRFADKAGTGTLLEALPLVFQKRPVKKSSSKKRAPWLPPWSRAPVMRCVGLGVERPLDRRAAPLCPPFNSTYSFLDAAFLPVVCRIEVLRHGTIVAKLLRIVANEVPAR